MRGIEHARKWAKQGLITEAALQRIEAAEADEPQGSVVTLILLAGAALVLAAAIYAFPVFLEATQTTFKWYVSAAAALVATGTFLIRNRSEFAEPLTLTTATLLVGAGVSWSLDGIPYLAWALLGLGFAGFAIRSQTVLVPIAAFALAVSMTPVASFDLPDSFAVTAWLVSVSLVAGGLLALRTWADEWRDRTEVVMALAPPMLAIAALVWFFEEFSNTFQGAGELVVFAFQVPILLWALWQRDRPALVGTVLVIAVDAVVFGFDVGSLALGIPMLLLVAGALVALALWAKRAK